jgi:hypothetical protein
MLNGRKMSGTEGTCSHGASQRRPEERRRALVDAESEGASRVPDVNQREQRRDGGGVVVGCRRRRARLSMTR